MARSSSDIAGKWTYRSFNNDPVQVGDDPKKALALIFAEAALLLRPLNNVDFAGLLDWDGGGMDLKGKMIEGSPDTPVAFAIVGYGRQGTSTDGWEYAYNGCLSYTWPEGIDQVPSLVGSIVRVKPHNGRPAGYTASFVAVLNKG
jgi:hypothetical protein